MKNAALTFLGACLLTSALAQNKTQVNAFLDIGYGSDHKALGNTGVALQSGSAAFWYNPALSPQTNRHQVQYTHSALFANLAQHDVLSYSRKIDSSLSIGVGFARLGVDNIQNTLKLYDQNGDLDYSRIQLFNASDQVLYASANKDWNDFRVGVAAKLIYRKLGDFAQAFGLGFDVGISGDYKGYSWGAVLKDVTTTTSYWIMNFSEEDKATLDATGNEIPENGAEVMLPHAEFGITRKFHVSPSIDLRPIVDLHLRFGERIGTWVENDIVSLDPRIGGEIIFKKVFSVNCGIDRVQSFKDASGKRVKQLSPTLGAGLKFDRFQIYYGLGTVGQQSTLLSNVFSLAANF